MSNYLYQTIISRTQSSSDKSDYETNHKSDIIEISQIKLLETTFILEESYSDFSAKIDGIDIKWSDVTVITSNDKYWLFLLSDTAL